MAVIIADPEGNNWLLGVLNDGRLTTASVPGPATSPVPVFTDGTNNWQLGIADALVAFGQPTTTLTGAAANGPWQFSSPDGANWTLSVSSDGSGRLTTSKFVCVVPYPADVTESQFGLKPGQLVCFDCNSTLLTVSADYSIWCCDCQAFILPEKTNEFVLLE